MTTFNTVGARPTRATHRMSHPGHSPLDLPLTRPDRPLPELPGVARRLVAEHLRRWGLTTLLDDAQVVTSELVDNAVRHAVTTPSDQVVLLLFPTTDSVWIGVMDPSTDPPRPRDPDPLSESGRGLALVVTQLTRGQWGSEPVPNGKVVWARLTTYPE